ncbi:MAG: ribonuclease HIII [Vampirovibrionales bacterium]|nr:ribonuclease HIII [Vampirovibrionales bacterium]
MYKAKLASPVAQARLKRAVLGVSHFEWREQAEQYCAFRLDGARRGAGKALWVRVKQYANGTLLIDAATPDLLQDLLSAVQSALPAGSVSVNAAGAGPASGAKPLKASGQLDVAGAYIGTDESGKGDYFGPLVIAGACVDDAALPQLAALGVMDSKKLSDDAISRIAAGIRQALGPDRVLALELAPARYNEVYADFRARGRNLNHLLAWGHASVIERLLAKNPQCAQAIADQFGGEHYIRNELQEKGRAITLFQTPRAEANPGVAAASILARDCFVRKLRALGETFDLALPPGAGSPVKTCAKAFVRQFGKARLSEVAKLHFKTTQEL